MTLLVGVLARDLSTFRFVSAGHPPPLVAAVDGASFVEGRANPPLGLPQPPSFVEQEVPLEPGTRLLLYTDGLVERRGESLDGGLERLRSAAEGALHGRSPADAVSELLQRMIGDQRPTDDVALLMIGREAPDRELEFAMEARARSLVSIRRALYRWLTDLHVPDDVVHDVVMAASEAAANVVEHAYGPDSGTITIVGSLEDDRVVRLEVRDTGTWRGSSRPDRGQGVPLMRALMDDVVVDSSSAGTVVTLIRKKPA